MRLPLWVRIGLLYSAAAVGFVGAWALPAPRSFYDRFPGMGMEWASASGPYNEHFIRDFGAFELGFALLFLWAAFRPTVSLLRAVTTTWVVVQVPHVIFHAAHDENLTSREWTTQLASLLVLLAVGVAVAVWAWRVSEPGGSPAPSP